MLCRAESSALMRTTRSIPTSSTPSYTPGTSAVVEVVQQQQPSVAVAQAKEDSGGSEKTKLGVWAHVFFATALLLSSIILVAVSHSEDIEKRLDFVKLYSYKKAVPDKSKAVESIVSAVKQNSWINQADSPCLDMSFFTYPQVRFDPANDPTGPSCQISFSVKLGVGVDQVQFDAVYEGNVVSCKPGTYNLIVTGGTGTVSTPPRLVIVGGNGISNSSSPSFELSVVGSFGFNYATFNSGYLDCRKGRFDLAKAILSDTACEHGTASPMCACVSTFTSQLTKWDGKLIAKPAPGVVLQDVLSRGIERCLDLRRTHDVRKPIEQSYARSRALLYFSLALFFNALYAALLPWIGQSVLAHVGILAGYFLGILLAGLLDADSSGGEFGTVLAITIPAFLVHGGYGLLLRFNHRYDETKLPVPAPFLHPVTFDICLCALTLFTLVERGVVQSEYLIVEIFKCHAVAAIYIGITWYHRYGGSRTEDSVFSAEPVQQAYLGLFLVGLVAACAPMIVPYPAKKCFEMHWLLPGAFTYLAFSNPAWAHSLQFAHKLASTAVDVTSFNEVAGLFALLFGSVLWGYFLQDHLQVYGASHFPYPSVRDPLAPVTMRMI